MVKSIALLIFILVNLFAQINSAPTTSSNAIFNSFTAELNEPAISTANSPTSNSSDEILLAVTAGAVAISVLTLLLLFVFSRDLLLLTDGLLLLSTLALTISIFSLGSAWQVNLSICLLLLISSLSTLKNQDLFFYQAWLQFAFKGLAALSIVAMLVSLFISLNTNLVILGSLLCLAVLCQAVSVLTQWKNDLPQRKFINLGILLILFDSILVICHLANVIVLPLSEITLLQISMLTYLGFILFEAAKSYHSTLDGFPASTELHEEQELQLSGQMLELQFALKELQEKNEQLEKLNTLDELSGIHNRRHFDKRLQAELRRCRRELAPLSLIMFDIDHFKKFNDSYGHIAGDEVIRTVALTSSQQLNRDSDEIFRYGGEEYAIILPNTDLEGAMFIAEKVRAAVANTKINCNDQTLNCTVSLGVCCHLSEQAMQTKDFIERADKALYQSKQNGRNQVAHYNQ